MAKRSNNLATSTKQLHLHVTQLDLGHPSDLEHKEVDRAHPSRLVSSNMSLPFLPFPGKKTGHLMKVDITTVTTVTNSLLLYQGTTPSQFISYHDTYVMSIDRVDAIVETFSKLIGRSFYDETLMSIRVR